MRIKSLQSHGRIKYSVLRKKIYRIISLRSSVINNSWIPMSTLFNCVDGQQIHNPRTKIRKHPSNRLEKIPEAKKL